MLNRLRRCAGRTLALSSLLLPATSPVHAEGLIEGIEGYADAVSGLSTAKWAGQRVPWPAPTPRPISLGRLDSTWAPLSVHATSHEAARRLPAVLSAAEQALLVLRASGLFELRDDGGQAGTFQRDLYVVSSDASGAALDATEPVWGLDAARAFVTIDARVPEALLAPCTAQALIEAELYELDPAEAPAVRRGSAAYFTTRVLGESCPALPAASSDGVLDVLHDADGFAAWVGALDARQARGTGVFLANMWQFARQRTWEGSGLRGSPDLLEAIGKALELRHERLEEVAGAIALHDAMHTFDAIPRVTWSQLPVHRPAVSPALLPLRSAYLVVDLEQPRVGERLTVWSRGESPVRWVLSATRLDAQGAPLSTINAAVRKYPESELHVELDARTHAVLVSISNLGSGKLDADTTFSGLPHSVRLIVDRGR